MLRPRRFLVRALLASSALALAACGGASRSGPRDDGRAGAAGAGASAGSGSGGAGCDLGSCVDGCLFQGRHYEPGESFSAGDGCNSCSCGADGNVDCTLIDCPTCDDFRASYGGYLESAKECDPRLSREQCTGTLGEGLTCGCEVFVNPDNVDVLSAARETQAAYAAAKCGLGVVCGACAQSIRGYCSGEGRCETLWDDGGTACKVGGVTYPNGAGDIPDPVSCNKCQCQNGQLSCTEIYCPVACPPASVYGTQCDECAPDDACLVIEHACLPVCSPGTDSCRGGFCLDGVCRTECG
jgi:hypothetical protein